MNFSKDILVRKQCCIDTCGLTTPLNQRLPKVHVTFWRRIRELITRGDFAATNEIYAELCKTDGDFGEFLRASQDKLLIPKTEYSIRTLYYKTVDDLINRHRAFIFPIDTTDDENVSIADITIIALAKVLDLPLVTGEVLRGSNAKKKKIPNICSEEGVRWRDLDHYLLDNGITA